MSSRSIPTIKDYQTNLKPTWCPGCGNYTINTVLQQALVDLKLPPEKVVITYDIGCNGNGADKIRTYTFKSLHGRSLPPAIGIKYANHDLTVIATIGDGGMFWEGAAHWIAACQRNEDITVLVWDNQIYALTTGQTSPTTQYGYPTKTTPQGNFDEPINPITVSLAAGATFVARGWVGQPSQLKEIIKAAIRHPGFAIVDILQTCFTFNNQFQFYKEHTYTLDKPLTDKSEAYRLAEDRERFALGIFYQIKKNSIKEKHPLLKKAPLIHQPIDRKVTDLLKEFE